MDHEYGNVDQKQKDMLGNFHVPYRLQIAKYGKNGGIVLYIIHGVCITNQTGYNYK